jgi:hypothetical protein
MTLSRDVSHERSPSELVEVLVAEREGAPFLECRDTEGRLHLFRTASSDERPLSVGRRSEMDVAIVWDPKVSSLHAELACVGGEWTVADVGSTNGTFLNEERVKERRRLRDGDRVRVDSTVLIFRASPSASVEPTVRARPCGWYVHRQPSAVQDELVSARASDRVPAHRA